MNPPAGTLMGTYSDCLVDAWASQDPGPLGGLTLLGGDENGQGEGPPSVEQAQWWTSGTDLNGSGGGQSREDYPCIHGVLFPEGQHVWTDPELPSLSPQDEESDRPGHPWGLACEVAALFFLSLNPEVLGAHEND